MRYTPEPSITHLHWLWRKGPAELRGIKIAGTICGKTVSRKEVTSHLEDTTCKECLKRKGKPR